jgi:hypothetical protein
MSRIDEVKMTTTGTKHPSPRVRDSPGLHGFAQVAIVPISFARKHVCKREILEA